jgi:hypothetical protein
VTVAELRRVLAHYPGYLKVYVAPPDGARELEPTASGSVIDHQTYGWLTLDSEEVP